MKAQTDSTRITGWKFVEEVCHDGKKRLFLRCNGGRGSSILTVDLMFDGPEPDDIRRIEMAGDLPLKRERKGK